MAYDASIAGGYPGKAGYDLFMYCRRDQTDNANNRSSYAWALQQRNWASNTPSWVLDAKIWYAVCGGQAWEGYINCDFRGTGIGGVRNVSSGSTNWIYHDGSGYLNVSFACSHVTGYWGTAEASGVLYSDRIPKPPAPPGAIGFSNITPTSVELYVPGSPDSNGSPIDSYLIRLSKNSNPEVAPFTDYTPNVVTGRVVATGLTPGATYYAKGYAHNAMGYSNGGATTSFKTLSGAYVGKSDVFQGCEVLVGKSSVFVSAEVRIGKDGSFVLAT